MELNISSLRQEANFVMPDNAVKLHQTGHAIIGSTQTDIYAIQFVSDGHGSYVAEPYAYVATTIEKVQTEHEFYGNESTAIEYPLRISAVVGEEEQYATRIYSDTACIGLRTKFAQFRAARRIKRLLAGS